MIPSTTADFIPLREAVPFCENRPCPFTVQKLFRQNSENPLTTASPCAIVRSGEETFKNRYRETGKDSEERPCVWCVLCPVGLRQDFLFVPPAGKYLKGAFK